MSDLADLACITKIKWHGNLEITFVAFHVNFQVMLCTWSSCRRNNSLEGIRGWYSNRARLHRQVVPGRFERTHICDCRTWSSAWQCVIKVVLILDRNSKISKNHGTVRYTFFYYHVQNEVEFICCWSCWNKARLRFAPPSAQHKIPGEYQQKDRDHHRAT